MNIKLVKHENEGELLLEGKLDTNTAPEAQEIFMQMTERFDTLVLNMTDLKYISSAGLRVLKIVHVAMAKKGGELVITNPNDMITEVFELTGFAGILNIR